jgi:hypothetical protein
MHMLNFSTFVQMVTIYVVNLIIHLNPLQSLSLIKLGLSVVRSE